MVAASDFESFYSAKLLPELELLEQERKKVVAKFWSGIAYGVLCIPALIPFVMFENPWLLLILVAPVLLVIYRLTFYDKDKAIYVQHFKSSVIESMVKHMGDQLSYQPASQISMNEYCLSEIFHNRIDRFRGGDLISGMLGKTMIRFSELHHEEKHVTTDSKGNRHESWVTIFRGVFFIGDFNKNFNGKTFVLPDSGIDFLGIGKWMDKVFSSRGEAVSLEDPVFEKHFKCYSSDQVEARYILSTSMMERLSELKEKAGSKIYLSFINSKIFIAIPINKDLFEPNVFSSGLKQDYLRDYYDSLHLITGIVEDLNLNTRIWTKQ